MVRVIVEEGEKGFIQLRFYALERRDCKQGLCDAGAESGNDGSGAGDLAVGIFEEGFVKVEGDEACPTPFLLSLVFCFSP